MNRYLKKSLVGIFALSVMGATPSFAAEGGSRVQHRIGAYMGLLGDPFPTLVGFDLGFNVFDFLRLVVGYGTISVTSADLTTGGTATLSATTIGGGFRAFLPGWSFSPVVGLSYANVSVKATGTLGSQTVGGFGESAHHLYASFGFDWQAHSGFNLGLGYNYSFRAGTGGAPFINLGWFF